jgi:hypothetical protein
VAEGFRRGVGCSPIEATAALARHLDTDGSLAGHPLLDLAPDLEWRPGGTEVGTAYGPDLLGLVYERLLSDSERREQGSHFTPARLADRLVALAFDGSSQPETVCDPAVGSGAFLLAAARALEARGLPRVEIVEALLHGSDVDAGALLVTDAALAMWSGGTRPLTHLLHGDAVGSRLWDRHFDLVVGNPPFLSQLAAATARSRPEAARLQERFGGAALGYVDSAALFLLAGLELAEGGGQVLMIQPHSTLAALDAEGVRRAVIEGGVLTAVWLGDRSQFEADVEVCALLTLVGEPTPSQPIRVFAGDEFDELPEQQNAGLVTAPTWSVFLAAAVGVPDIDIVADGVMADIASATAGFRDQFYGLAEFTVEAEPEAGRDRELRLTTVGMIDPGRSRWGTTSFRFNGRRWDRPVVDHATMALTDSSLAKWVGDRLVPKVCVATQTRVIEAVVDDRGDLVPATPVISVEPDPVDVWLVAAALQAPPVTAWALRNHAGAALSRDALRMSAKQVLAVPLPEDRSLWEQGAVLLQEVGTAARGEDGGAWRSALTEFGAIMCAAYGQPVQPLLAWWEARLPAWR